MGRLWYLDDNDERNIKVLEDFAHHLGNWVDGIPKWYDWEKHRFLNRYLGTVKVSNDSSTDFNYVGMFRWIIVALQTYLATGMKMYLDLCLDYTNRWCEFMEQAKEGEWLPMTAGPNWENIENPMSHELPADRVLTGGCCSSLLDFYLLTKNPRYSAMVKRTLREILKAAKLRIGNPIWTHFPSAHDWVSSVVAGNLANYRVITGDDEFDSVILDAVKKMGTCSLPRHLETSGQVPNLSMRWLYQTENGTEAEIKGLPPTVEALLFQITGDVKYISHALALTVRKLELVRPLSDEGRQSGCAHGNINGGVVLTDVHATLFPATMGLYGLCQRGVSHYRPLVTYRKENGTIGLPKGVAALFIPTESDRRVVQLYNDNNEKITLEVTAHSSLIEVGKSPLKTGAKSKTIQLEPHQTIKIWIEP